MLEKVEALRYNPHFVILIFEVLGDTFESWKPAWTLTAYPSLLLRIRPKVAQRVSHFLEMWLHLELLTHFTCVTKRTFPPWEMRTKSLRLRRKVTLSSCQSLTRVDNSVYPNNDNVQPSTNCTHTHSNQDPADPTYGKQAHQILCTFQTVWLPLVGQTKETVCVSCRLSSRQSLLAQELCLSGTLSMGPILFSPAPPEATQPGMLALG